MAAVVLRELVHDDLLLLYDWLCRSAVRRGYGDAPKSFAEVDAKYGPRARPGHAVKAFIVQQDGRDVGYVQGYFLRDFPDYARICDAGKDDFGIDLFIADPHAHGRGTGSATIARFTHDVAFALYGADACLAGPRRGNDAAIRAFAQAGFVPLRTIVNERGETECLHRLPRLPAGFRIATIDLAASGRTCVDFHRDMYATAFGTIDGLEDEMGPGDTRYLQALAERIAAVPGGNAHLWQDDAIVGQLEMKPVADAPHVAYLSLLYVRPDRRDLGCGAMLHGHAAQVARRNGQRVLRLSVAQTNTAARAFYEAIGYRQVGTRPNVRPMEILELDLA